MRKPPSQPPPRASKPLKIFLTALLIGALLFVVTALYLVHITPPDRRKLVLNLVRMVISPGQVAGEAFPGKERVTILVLGLDVNWTRQHVRHTKETRSDTMILVNVLLSEKKVRLLSIPRDTRVEIPPHGWEKINAAHALGGKDGPKLARQVVQKLLGIPIDHHVILRFDSVKNMVKAVGGIEIDVEKTMHYDDNWGQLHIHLKKGRQRLDGQKAMEYSRFRNDAEGDYGRIRRQQQVIRAIQREILRPANLSRLPELAETARANVDTDLTDKQILALGFSLRHLSPTDMVTFTLPTVPRMHKEGGYWVSYVEVEEEKLMPVVKSFLSPAPVIELPAGTEIPRLTVEVLDGGGNLKRAEKVAATLREAGFKVTKIAPVSARPETTTIHDHTGRGNGLIVAKLLAFGQPVSAFNPSRTVDLTILLGKDR